ncbi:MAG: DUF2236 domain-containing protein [Myxococcales bacterium]|nr:DUF2236 domain-containing protein [Myxococcales bacterium]
MLDLLDLVLHRPHTRAGYSDAARDHLAIMRTVFLRDFAAEIRLGAALALFRVFAVPRLSATLARTGAWVDGGRERLDRTVELLTTLVADGYDGPRGAAALARINAAHGRHRIANDDMRYVLTTFVSEPARVIERYGPRPLLPLELAAACVFWREVGRRMGIRDIPADFAAMTAYARDYEARHRRPAASNRVVAAGALAAMAQRLPPRLAPLGRGVLPALLEPAVRRACGLPDSPGPLAWALDGLAAARRRLVAWAPAPG